MNIIAVGLSHKTAPVELRELLAVPESRVGEALSRLMAYQGIREGMFLQTCNRVEVVAVVDQVEEGFSAIREFFVATHLSLSAEQLLPHFYWHAGDRAITHLFRVAASLDSMVIGEPQILGQVKEAFASALTHNTSGVILNKLAKKAISVAKRVRTESRIAENAVSVSYAAVELAKKVFSDLASKTVLLVGAGEMAELAARHFVSQGVNHVLITTRDSRRSADLAERFNGLSIPFEDFRGSLSKADIVLCSTGASHHVIGSDDVQRAVRERLNRPLFLIDVSVPRNIDPAAKEVDNAFLFDIDDLEIHVENNLEDRRREAEKAESIIEGEVTNILGWLKTLEATPTIVALRRRAEKIKASELEKAFSRLGSLSQQDRATVETLASALVNKLLHGSLVTLKSAAKSTDRSIYIEAARRFFHLEETDSSPTINGTDSALPSLPLEDNREEEMPQNVSEQPYKSGNNHLTL